MWSLIILFPYFCLFIYFKESRQPQQKHHGGTASSESLGLNWFNVRITPVLDSAVTHKHVIQHVPKTSGFGFNSCGF